MFESRAQLGDMNKDVGARLIDSRGREDGGQRMTMGKMIRRFSEDGNKTREQMRTKVGAAHQRRFPLWSPSCWCFGWSQKHKAVAAHGNAYVVYRCIQYRQYIRMKWSYFGGPRLVGSKLKLLTDSSCWPHCTLQNNTNCRSDRKSFYRNPTPMDIRSRFLYVFVVSNSRWWKKWKRYDLQRDMGCRVPMVWQPRFGDSKGSPVWSSMEQGTNSPGLWWLMMVWDVWCWIVAVQHASTCHIHLYGSIRIYTDLWSLHIYTGVVPADEHCLMCKGRWTWWSFRWRARCLLMDCIWLNSFEFNTFHSHCTRPPSPTLRSDKIWIALAFAPRGVCDNLGFEQTAPNNGANIWRPPTMWAWQDVVVPMRLQAMRNLVLAIKIGTGWNRIVKKFQL